MRKVAVLVTLALVLPAMADLQSGAKLVGSPGARSDYLVYDNTWNPTNYGYQAALGTAIGDELLLDFSLVPEGVAHTLNDLTISIGSFDEPGLQYADVSIDLFNFDPDSGTFIFAGNVSLPGQTFNLAPGYFDALTVNNLGGLNIALTDDILITVTVTNANVADVGQLIYDPPVLGYSGDYFYQNGSWYWFGGNPVANFYYAVSVPEPASLGLLALGALLFVRRR